MEPAEDSTQTARAKGAPGKTAALTPGQKAARTRAEKQALEKANARRLAQIVNLHIAGYSLADIGVAIGATPDEVDRMLSNDTARYVRSQPALRTYVRNYVSSKYTALLETVWSRATDPLAPQNLECVDRAERILARMAKLHGAEAPQQHEVQVDAAPEAVEQLVHALSTAQGLGYDTSVFDVVDAEVVSDAVTESAAALEVSGNRMDRADSASSADKAGSTGDSL